MHHIRLKSMYIVHSLYAMTTSMNVSFLLHHVHLHQAKSCRCLCIRMKKNCLLNVAFILFQSYTFFLLLFFSFSLLLFFSFSLLQMIQVYLLLALCFSLLSFFFLRQVALNQCLVRLDTLTELHEDVGESPFSRTTIARIPDFYIQCINI